jgi:ribosomal protein S27AE
MSDASANEVVRASANRLYWNSADTVDEIAERLGIGRSAIYSAIRPIPADADCPHCGAGLVFANRSARAAGRARCPECGRTHLVGESSHPFDRAALASAEAPPPAERPRRAPPPPRVPPAGLPGRGELRSAFASVEPHRVLLVGGAALLGVALGRAAVKALRRWT